MLSKICFLMVGTILILFVLIIFYYLWIKKKITPGFAADTDPYNYPSIIPNLLTTDQTNQIIQQSTPHLIESEVLSGNVKSIRNSSQHWIKKTDPLVKPIFEQISKQFNIPFANAEDLQVVRYLPNQYYNEHHDSCCESNVKCEEFIRRGGQRILTVLIYLNNEFEDGGTIFKNLNLTLKPKTGDAIVFFPLASNSNRCHPFALHAGLPVSSGVKWIANLWFREHEFH